jgi:MFS family permease
VFVSLILAITERGGGYATAGAVIAALTLAAGLALPVFGRLIDRYGQRSTEPEPAGLAAGGGVGSSLRIPALRALYAGYSSVTVIARDGHIKAA